MSTYRVTENHPPAFSTQQGATRQTGAQPHAEKFRPGRAFRMANRMMTMLLKAGAPMGPMYLLTVRGRKSGEPRTTPITVIDYEGERWIASPYGQVDWVRNLRAAGEATLRRGRRVELLSAQEVSAAEAAPLLKWTMNTLKVPGNIRAQYPVALDAPLSSWEQEAQKHPVFLLRPTSIR